MDDAAGPPVDRDHVTDVRRLVADVTADRREKQVAGEVELAGFLRHHGARDCYEGLNRFIACARGARSHAGRQLRGHRRAEVGAHQDFFELFVVTGRERGAEGAKARRESIPGPVADPAPDALLLLAQPAWAVDAARVAGLRMSSSRTETRWDEPLSSRWMPYSVEA